MLSATYAAMNIGSKITNKVVNLGDHFKPKPKVNPEVIDAADVCMADLKHLNLLKASAGTSAFADDAIKVAKEALATSRVAYRQVSRAAQAQDRNEKDRKLAEILSKNPSAVFSMFREASRNSMPVVSTMRVDDKTYAGDTVPDGIFDSLNQLKAQEMDPELP